MTRNKLALSAACGALLTVSLMACSSMDTDGDSSSEGMQSSNTSGSELSATDKQFITEAATGGMAEVKTAELALQKTSNDAVRQFAQHMIEDHTKANQQLMQIASAKGVTLPATPDAKHQEAMQDLQQLSGAEFDKMYMQQAGLKDHKEMAELFQKQTDEGQDPDLKAFAAKVLPDIKEHLSMAQKITGETAG